MTTDRPRWGPLAWRLLLAFVLVALSSVLVLAAAALLGTDRGLAAAEHAERQQTAEQVATAAGAAYAAAGSWTGARPDAAVAIATGAGARLVVRDVDGSPVTGRGHGMPGMSTPMAGALGGGRVDAPVVVSGVTVGAVQLAFGTSTASAAKDVAWGWIALAAAVALLLAVTASWFVSRRIADPLVRLTATAKDIAAGDRSARALLRAPGELGELADAFDHMADQVTRADRARRNLTADVAHELRTPLATLQAGLEELRDGLEPPDVERLTSLHDQALRLGRVVQDLADLTAAENAAVSLRLTDFDLAALIGEVVTAHSARLRAAGIDVHSELTEHIPVHADPDRLHQAVGNLLGNTARYARPGDSVTIRTRSAGGAATIEVADTGPGIPADELPHVFERRWRGRSGAPVPGAGIGLAVVRELVTAHGGTVTAASEPDGGSTFTITLPLKDAGGA
ncbi:MAG TPA: HAMP domain-containing sensor histidine kinase [Amycolatopsis sp.]|uniref:histidine kinase n=1 Tax=Amycolatopsis nalaikhensis TaxID=715472 RepID=A0ABY8XDZ8_9PSEU|nr:HAMP domain-containing sensor histidine kinase [Amycolatopsis sp. 2-2]WIV53841.1 HAMP domain-containing sensor histidine kinase [Amycolatopsis sp. 2-2]HWD02710.1 HAMP domain-containing sensor histidine kinase [Amycolatopsis sp.]